MTQRTATPVIMLGKDKEQRLCFAQMTQKMFHKPFLMKIWYRNTQTRRKKPIGAKNPQKMCGLHPQKQHEKSKTTKKANKSRETPL